MNGPGDYRCYVSQSWEIGADVVMRLALSGARPLTPDELERYGRVVAVIEQEFPTERPF